MQVEITRKSDEDGHTLLTVVVEGEVKVRAHDADPEDATFNRNFNDLLFIGDIIKQAYEAGKNGEEFSLKEIEEDW